MKKQNYIGVQLIEYDHHIHGKGQALYCWECLDQCNDWDMKEDRSGIDRSAEWIMERMKRYDGVVYHDPNDLGRIIRSKIGKLEPGQIAVWETDDKLSAGRIMSLEEYKNERYKNEDNEGEDEDEDAERDDDNEEEDES